VAAWHADEAHDGFFDEVTAPRATVEYLLDHISLRVTGQLTFPEASSTPLKRLDPRVQARVLLDLAPNGDVQVEYVLHGLVGHANGLCGDLAGEARETASTHPAGATPTVVLTEGTNDAETLTQAMTVTHPHLMEHVRFLTFELKREGGAAALLGLVKGLSATRVGNRFVAIADNDAAARSVLKGAPTLPDNFRLLHYPPLDLLRAYPTRGPQSEGLVVMDVNGLAGSLEMYLGTDVLIDRGAQAKASPSPSPTPGEGAGAGTGNLFPVQWYGFMDNVAAYQGSLGTRHKKLARERFKEKVAAHHAGTGALDADWEGVRAIIELIVHAFDRPDDG